MHAAADERAAREEDAPASPPRAAIILAAGQSRRMRSQLPKVLHDVLGMPLVEHVVQAALAVGVERAVVVVSPNHREAVGAALAGHPQVRLAVQEEARGTAHAVLAAREALEGFTGTGLVLLGDAPCISPDSLRALLAEHAARAARLSVLAAEVDQPRGYGRIVRGPDGDLAAIVEEKDATEDVRALREINSGTFALELPALWDVLARIQPSPHTGELYVTDAVELLRAEGARVVAVNAATAVDVLGVNERTQLARVTAVLRERINRGHMERGVTIVDPATTFIDARARLDPDVRVEPFSVVQGPCHLQAGARVGPFAHVRGGSTLGPGARAGSFVEVVRSQLGAGTQAAHLSYLGDATLGAGVNVGAGTVFANYDGRRHHRSEVADEASLGAGTMLVAPAQVGRGARTGAGAVVVRRELPAGTTWVGVPARPLPASSAADGGEA